MKTKQNATLLWAFLMALSCSITTSLGQDSVAEILLNLRSRMSPTENPALMGVRLNESLTEEIWHFQFFDTNYLNMRRLITLKNGQFDTNRAEAIWPFNQVGYSRVLDIHEMSLPISKLRRMAVAQAQQAQLQPHSITLILSKPPQEFEAIWEVYFLGKKQSVLGTLTYNAKTGKLIRTKLTKSQ